MTDKTDERRDEAAARPDKPVLDMGLGSRNQGFRRQGKPQLKVVAKAPKS